MPKMLRTPPPSSETKSCNKCSSPDNDEMVQCDDCDFWYHFVCVNVTQEVENLPWSCPTCSQKLSEATGGQEFPQSKGINDDKQTGLIVSRVTGTKSCKSKSSLHSNTQILQLNLKKLEEEQEAKRKQMELEKSFIESQRVYAKEEAQNREERYRILNEIAIESSSISQRSSHGNESVISKHAQIEDWVQKSNDAKRTESRKTSVLAQPSRTTMSVLSLDKETRCNRPSGPLIKDYVQFMPQQFGPMFQGANLQGISDKYEPTNSRYPSQNYQENPQQRPTIPQSRQPMPNAQQSSNYYGYGFPNQNQLNARQIIPKELPKFDGNAEDWPMFITAYEESSQMCGFSNQENMFRLQRCLKGKALALVKGDLIHPGNVGTVISTLRMLYGRPANIINNLVHRLRETPPPKIENFQTIMEFSVAVRNLCSTIAACNMPEYFVNPLLLQELVNKLPPMLRLSWATNIQQLPVVGLSEFSSWMTLTAEAAGSVSIIPFNTEKSTRRDTGRCNAHTEFTSKPNDSPKNTCVICSGECTSVVQCKIFLDLELPSKWNAVRKNKLCTRCLKRHKPPCRSTELCGIHNCPIKHNKLLHNYQKDQNPSPAVTSATCYTHQQKYEHALFKIVPIIATANGIEICDYAFLDDGSSVTLLDSQLASELKLSGELSPLCLKWTGNTERVEENSMKVSLKISGLGENVKFYGIHAARTVSNIDLPTQTLPVKSMQELYPHLKQLPITPYHNVKPRILIGLDNWHVAAPIKIRDGKIGEPIALKSRLGWIVQGQYNDQTVRPAKSPVHHSFTICECRNNDTQLHDMVKSFFSLESIGVTKLEKMPESKDNERALQILDNTTQRIGDRFSTGLLWKFDSFKLPNSYTMALKRLACLEKRLAKEPELAQNVNKQITEYEKKGFITKLNGDVNVYVDKSGVAKNIERKWYLPIFPVINPNKPGKVRIVWDAAAKSQGVSLNDFLLKGPDQLTLLPSVLHRFRQRKIALCADIREMFHQIVINHEDQHCQRFLWRNNETSRDPDIYVMHVMTFGAKCSPCSAQFIKNRNATEHSKQFPREFSAIINNHYVDDYLDSVDDEEQAVVLARNIISVHSKGGFVIRNWLSNSPYVKQQLQEETELCKNLNIDKPAVEKILGMWWSTETDSFNFRIIKNHSSSSLLTGLIVPTKRELLRILMTIFDPLGLIANYLIYLKMILQEIWRAKTNWDEKIPVQQFEKWKCWLQYLPQIENLSIPRCHQIQWCSSSTQLHVFVDASEYAYATVCYFRSESEKGITCSLIGAKSRVAPLKFLSIPRMELQAGLLGCRFAQSIVSSYEIKIDKSYFWTDSKDVICWLLSDHRRYSQFVAHRISEIQELTNVSDWHWISSKQNVADDATKWKPMPNITSRSRWFTGPEFLLKPEKEWPVKQAPNDETKEEIRCNIHAIDVDNNATTKKFGPIGCIIDVTRFSNWHRIHRCVAYVLRFINNVKPKNKEKTAGLLAQEELMNAEILLYRQAQSECYPCEIVALAKGRSGSQGTHISTKSSIFNLNPYLDKEGLLRLEGRIENVNIADEYTKRPIILPRKHPVTALVISSYHQRFNHINHESVVNEIRQKFYIKRLRVTYKSIRRNCNLCKIRNTNPQPPQMGQLPEARLALFTRPFAHVGIDYFGPFSVTVGRRSEKRWGVLFTCLTIRAIHLEVAHSLTTESCIMAIRNFMARRGAPSEIWSDRGTNFKGASKELATESAKIDHKIIWSKFTTSETKWNFIPPASPHMGGCWERLVRIVKANLLQITNGKSLSDEKLRNLFTEIEFTVNSRPLTYIPLEDENSEALTPNHFLLGSSNGMIPLSTNEPEKNNLQRSYKLIQQLADKFWNRWLTEYLPNITRRSKWFTNVKPIKKGDIVIIVDPNTPRYSWPKGKIIETKSGKDGQIRSVTVQTATGIYERPTVKIAVLDILEQSS